MFFLAPVVAHINIQIERYVGYFDDMSVSKKANMRQLERVMSHFKLHLIVSVYFIPLIKNCLNQETVKDGEMYRAVNILVYLLLTIIT